MTTLLPLLVVLAQTAPEVPRPPAQCGETDPQHDAVEIVVSDVPRVALTPLALSCLLTRIDVLEGHVDVVERYYRGVVTARQTTAEEREASLRREMAEAETAFAEEMNRRDDSVVAWKALAGIGLAAGVVVGGTVGYLVWGGE